MEKEILTFFCDDEVVTVPLDSVSTASESEVKTLLTSLFRRREDSFLALLKDDGKPVDLKKKDWCLAGERKFVPVFQDASPLKKVKLDTAEPENKTTKLVRLFKNAGNLKTELETLENGVVEVKPDLPLVKKYNISTGQVNLRNSIDFAQTYCLNEDGEHPWARVFEKGKQSYLRSDVDEQLLLSVRFAEPVNLHSLIIKSYENEVDSAPAQIKLFFNVFSLDFDSAESRQPRQVLSLTPQHYKENKLITLDPFKWETTTCIALFVVSNLGRTDVSIIRSIKFIGKPSKRKA